MLMKEIIKHIILELNYHIFAFLFEFQPMIHLIIILISKSIELIPINDLLKVNGIYHSIVVHL